MNDYFDSLCAATPARLQIGRTGSRYKTKAISTFVPLMPPQRMP